MRGTPVSSYRVPGLMLGLAVGSSATVATAATLRNPRAGGLVSMLAGLVMMGWIAGEARILKQPPGPHWTEHCYFAVGLLMAALGLLAGRAERTN